MRTFILSLAALLALGACDRAEPEAKSDPKAQAEPQAYAMWQGHWTGPEGTSLDIEPGMGPKKLTVTIRDLDGARTFDAKADGGTVQFRRDETVETIRPGTGADTGMKWLADKKTCLVVKAGEGYCRD